MAEQLKQAGINAKAKPGMAVTSTIRINGSIQIVFNELQVQPTAPRAPAATVQTKVEAAAIKVAPASTLKHKLL